MSEELFFKLFPMQKEGWKVRNDIFKTEQEAKDYTKHFNLGKPEKITRPEEEKPAAKGKGKGKEKEPDTTDTTAEGEGGSKEVEQDSTTEGAEGSDETKEQK